MSKAKQFRETSSIFQVDNIKNEAILRGFLQKWKVECRADGLVPRRFAIFALHLSKVLRLPRKSDARSYEVLHLSGKIILANLKIGCSKTQPLSGNQRPHLLTPPMKMSLALRLPRKMHLCRSSSNVPRLPTLVKLWQNPHVSLRCRIPCACHAKSHLNLQKWSEHGFFFKHFDSETRFAPQRRALFRHLNFQECSERGALCTFWLRNVLRATTAHFFDISTSKSAQVFCTFWLRCASRHNSVQFFISHLTRCCRTRRFSEPTFRPSGATKSLEKTHWVATFLPFCAPASSFFWLFLFFDPCLFFSSPLWFFPPLLFISPYCRKFDF